MTLIKYLNSDWHIVSTQKLLATIIHRTFSRVWLLFSIIQIFITNSPILRFKRREFLTQNIVVFNVDQLKFSSTVNDSRLKYQWLKKKKKTFISLSHQV